MKFQYKLGSNHKEFVHISDLTTGRDFELYEIIKGVLFRSEFKPFMQSFNKKITYSYLFSDYWFPYVFWQDVKKVLESVAEPNEKIILEGEPEHNLDKQELFNFISNLQLPDKIKINDERYQYQFDSVYNALKQKVARIEVATSGGKTFITYMYCRYCLNVIAKETDKANKVLIIVPSKLLAQQLKSDFEEFQSKEEIGNHLVIESIYSGSKRVLNANVVCGTYQSLFNYEKEFFDDFRFIICDEVHKAKAWSIKEEIYNKITEADYFFGMSGTYPKYKTLDYLHIVSMFGPCVYKYTSKQLMDSGVAANIKLHVIKINYSEDKHFSQQLIEAGCVGRDKYEVEKEYFQTNENRNNLIVKLLKHFKKNALILVDTVSYCEYLENIISENLQEKDVRIIHGKVKNRTDIISDMKQTKENFVLIGTYGTMSTGVSIPSIQQIYFVDGGKSEIRIRQSLGRGMRLDFDKNTCDVFDFYDNMKGSSFSNHARERLRIYKEQKFDFKITEVTI
jgi:DEAD/DEAH box helicase|nr:MAG TPA: DNA helicase [Caudoviricetes sp.]